MRIEHQDREWIRRREQAREWGPAGSRKYGNPAMLGIFTEETREKTYRTLWWKWARALANVGVGIPRDLLYNMEKLQDEEIDWERLDELREERGHEFVASLELFEEALREAGTDPEGWVHLACTSSFVADNTDLIQYRRALDLLSGLVADLCRALEELVMDTLEIPTPGFTHLQEASVTTWGKRWAVHLAEWVRIGQEIERARDGLVLLGSWGPVGNGAGLLEVLGDPQAVWRVQEDLAREMGFPGVWGVPTQTYPRAWDYSIVHPLILVGIEAKRFGQDLRFIQSLGFRPEKFREGSQVGSSAMGHKRNPIKAERLCSLGRSLISRSGSVASMAGDQWLERTLDDSAERRELMPEVFGQASAVMDLMIRLVRDIKEADLNGVTESDWKNLSEILLVRGALEGVPRDRMHEIIREASRREETDPKRGERFYGWIRSETGGKVKIEENETQSNRFIGLAGAQARAVIRASRNWRLTIDKRGFLPKVWTDYSN